MKGSLQTKQDYPFLFSYDIIFSIFQMIMSFFYGMKYLQIRKKRKGTKRQVLVPLRLNLLTLKAKYFFP